MQGDGNGDEVSSHGPHDRFSGYFNGSATTIIGRRTNRSYLLDPAASGDVP